jgi:hypothetical protein
VGTPRAPELQQMRKNDGRKMGSPNVGTVYSPKISKPIVTKSTNVADLLYCNVPRIDRNWEEKKKESGPHYKVSFGLKLIPHKTVHLNQFRNIKYTITVHTLIFIPFNNNPTIVWSAIIIS